MCGVAKPELGRLIWADFTDPQGKDSGRHPAVIVTKTADIEAGKPIYVAVISTKDKYCKAEDRMELKWSNQPGGHPITKLRRRCWVMYKWIVPIAENDIQGYAGKLYGTVLNTILTRVGQLLE